MAAPLVPASDHHDGIHLPHGGRGTWLGRLEGRVLLCWSRALDVCSPRAFLSLLLSLFEVLTISSAQSTFCVNSLAHWLGETPFDDKHTPKDHFITALVTVGEGYHNFVRSSPSRSPSPILTFSPQRSTTSSPPTSATPSSGTSTILPVRFLSLPRSLGAKLTPPLFRRVVHLQRLPPRLRDSAQDVPRQRDQEGTVRHDAQEGPATRKVDRVAFDLEQPPRPHLG